MSAQLSPKALLVLQAIEAAAEIGKRCPTNADLCKVAGLASSSGAVKLVAELEAEGLIAVERFTMGRRVTIIASGKATAETRATRPELRRSYGEPEPNIAPSNVRPAPPILTPRAADAMIGLMDMLGLSQREADEAAERRAMARRLTTAHPLPVRRPMPVLAAPVVGTGDRRPIADSRESCPRCQTRGDLGCAHQRPFIANQNQEVGND